MGSGGKPNSALLIRPEAGLTRSGEAQSSFIGQCRSVEEALMPTDIPNHSAVKSSRRLPRPVLITLLLLYMLAATTMLHAIHIAAPDVLLASAP